MNNMPFVDRSFVAWPELPSLTRFCQYLSRTGWIEVEQDNPKIRVFGTEQFGAPAERKKKDRAPFVILPFNDSYSDAKARIRDAIELIAFFRETDTSKIINETFRYEFDTIRQRIAAPNISGISLKFMPELLKHLRDCMKNAAQLEYDTDFTPYHFGKRAKANHLVEKFVENCLFGHTFEGSFGFSIEVPVLGNDRLSIDAPTIERSIVTRFAEGLKNTTDAIKNGDFNEIVNNYQKGFNSDICSSMSEIMDMIYKIDNATIEYSFYWSPTISQEGLPKEPITLVPAEAKQVFSEAEKEMIRLHGKEMVQIRGEVISLTDDLKYDEKNERNRRTIKLRCKNQKPVDIVFVTLSDTDYKLAGHAHFERKLLQLRGILEPEGVNNHRLKGPHSIKIIEPKNSLFHGLDQ